MFSHPTPSGIFQDGSVLLSECFYFSFFFLHLPVYKVFKMCIVCLVFLHLLPISFCLWAYCKLCLTPASTLEDSLSSSVRSSQEEFQNLLSWVYQDRRFWTLCWRWIQVIARLISCVEAKSLLLFLCKQIPHVLSSRSRLFVKRQNPSSEMI